MVSGIKLTSSHIINLVDSTEFTFVEFPEDNFKKITITCKKGHKSTITYSHFLKCKGSCKICSNKKRTKTTEQFIEDAICVHGWKYNYKLVNYIKNNLYVNLICTTCSCLVKVAPSNHLTGYNSCNCYSNSVTSNTKDFTKKATKIHKNKYDYNKVVYKQNKAKVQIYCNTCKLYFWISPNKHLSKEQGCRNCWLIKNSGITSSCWKGGSTLEPYCDAWQDKEYKKDIRSRDDSICQNPYCYKTDNVLHIHHIDYNKKNCHPNNLITVCRYCNSRANKDRKWHTEWYKILMVKRFSYKY